ncbi:hypothetical protein GCM10009790_39680 [Georgenia ruanii]|uniref:esterase/lipase family protein n=1 Tax=Georgenia ruanii TaxID=348442 RepID=UPI001D01FF15|nr:alpha/beta fold hydrolase [Georgenia ruanii]
MTESINNAPPIVLIHGLWMTPRSWDRWVEYYRAKGYHVIAPAYPGFEIEVEALREKPEIIAEATVPATLEHLVDVVEGLSASPPSSWATPSAGPSPSSWSTGALARPP